MALHPLQGQRAGWRPPPAVATHGPHPQLDPCVELNAVTTAEDEKERRAGTWTPPHPPHGQPDGWQPWALGGQLPHGQPAAWWGDTAAVVFE